VAHDADERQIERDEVAPGAGEPSTGIVVPWEQLSVDALRGVIEEFITREGTEYGNDELSLAQKIAQVQRQLTSGEVVVLFDANAETVNLLRSSELAPRGA
jgi:uncharacterized protein